MAVWREPEEGELWQLRVYSEEPRACQRGKVPSLQRHTSRGGTNIKHATRNLLQDPEVGTGCCYRTPEQAPNTAPAVLGALEERPPLGDLQAGVQGAAMLS